MKYYHKIERIFKHRSKTIKNCTIKRVLNEADFFAEIIRTLLHEQNIAIASILTALSITILTIVLATTGAFEGGRGHDASSLS